MPCATVGPVPCEIWLLLDWLRLYATFCKSSFCSLHPSPLSAFFFYPDPDHCSHSYYSSDPYSIATPTSCQCHPIVASTPQEATQSLQNHKRCHHSPPSPGSEWLAHSVVASVVLARWHTQLHGPFSPISSFPTTPALPASPVSPTGSTSSQVSLRMTTKAQSEAFDDHPTPPQTPMLASTRGTGKVPRLGLHLEKGQIVDGIHSHPNSVRVWHHPQTTTNLHTLTR